MAKVSLRIYNREIEGLIDQGQTDEAIAHCRHILKTFPKHLETYRLLGKAYLEARRYSEAVDIFSRVLNSVPEDFVAHVGMSIINDEQNQLDNAIWHMERAFEAQPSNAAIQGELQRLYGRRDGMEPPKVRMTRGALAHMYVQGELYPQAIAEIKAVLAQDAQRTDLQVLLARAYFKSGQKNDATELCSFLLKKAPYCFDANRIMVEALHANASASESTQGYRLRVGELDPYANFSKESVFRSNEVADAAINLERLEYSGQEVPIGQEWSSSLGINLGEGAAAAALTASSAEPDWLKSASAPEADIFGTAQPLEAQSAQPAEDIPDFLRAAGWGASSGPEQPTSFFDSEDATPNSTNEDLVSASIPDWLKGQMPVESTPPVAMDMSATEAPVADEDWLNNLTTAAQKNSQASHGEMPDWLSGSDNSASESVASSEPATKNADVPDWLSGLDDTKTESAPVAETQSNNDVPDWLAGLDKEEPAQTGADANVPDWLSGLGDSDSTPEATPQSAPNIESLGASAQEQDDAVAWLESLAAKHGAKPEELVTDPNKRSETAPEWVQQASAAQEANPAPQTAANIESLGASAQEQDDAVAWLESLAAKHGAKPEELVTDPNKRSETAPEWVQQASAAQEANPTPQPPANIESLGASAQEQDDAVAWLESLAAKHGAKPEELVTDPNKRSETAPEWVQQASAANEAKADPQPETAKVEISESAKNIGEQFFAEFEEAATAQPAAEDPAAWLKDLDAEPAQPAQEAKLPDWMGDAAQPTADDHFISQNLSQDDLANWLDNLDDGEKQPAPQFVAPEKDDLPNWLSGIDSDETPQPNAEPEKTASTAPEPAPASETGDNIPAWLQGVDEPSAAQELDDDDAPPWLRRESWEAEEKTTAPKPVTSADWHPMEAASQTPPKEVAKPVAQAPKVAQPVASPKPQPAQKQPKKAAEKREPQTASAALSQAKGELDRGDIPAALEHYEKLIKRGKHLEETIRDLTESIYRYPVEVGIWQTLGDAYMRANRLKEALEAYNKAEELIR